MGAYRMLRTINFTLQAIAIIGLFAMGTPAFAAPEQMPVDPMTDVPAGYEEAQRGQPDGFAGESDVFDTWFTSSLTPQIGSGWVLDPARHANPDSPGLHTPAIAAASSSR